MPISAWIVLIVISVIFFGKLGWNIGTTYKAYEKKHRRKVIICALFLMIVAIGIRLFFASQLKHPGHADYAYYYTLGENIASGKGFYIDYIWIFKNIPESVTHYANDYWMPLTSVIIAVFMYIFGSSLLSALLPSIIAGIVLSIVTYYIAKLYSQSITVRLGSAALVLFLPIFFRNSLLTDCAIYYALFGSLSLFFTIKGFSKAKFFFLAAVFAALCHLTRQDGVLLLITLICVISISNISRNRKIKYFFLCTIIYLIILSPLLISNYIHFNSPLPKRTLDSIFSVDYENIYSYSKDISLKGFIDNGLLSILFFKVKATIFNINILKEYIGCLFWAFFIIGIIQLLRNNKRAANDNYYRGTFLVPVCFLLFTFFLYSILFSTLSPSSFARTGLVALPFIIVISLNSLDSILPNRTLTYIIVSICIFFFIHEDINRAIKDINTSEQRKIELLQLKQVLDYESKIYENREVIVMTRNPWETYHTTRYRTVQIPDDNLDIILNVARKYKVTHIVLPAPRKALESISKETTNNKFKIVEKTPLLKFKLYRVLFNHNNK